MASFFNSNGANPQSALTLGNDGNFYGTTLEGGISVNSGYGTVFKVTPDGFLTTLVEFSGANGMHPNSGLTLAGDGNFYGATSEGGGSNDGTVFKVTTNGILSTLVSFSDPNAAFPLASLVQGHDGNFYGTTPGVSPGGPPYGTVFRMTADGALTTLAAFGGTNGATPWAALTLGNDGNFYGTTYYGGLSNCGTVFRLQLPPAVTTPPQLSLQFSAGYPLLTLDGTPGKDFLVQYITNLADSNWLNLLSVTNLPVSPYMFLDPAGAGQPARFYRAVVH